MRRSRTTPRSHLFGYRVPISVILAMVLIIGSPLAAVSQSRAQSLLERAQHLADLYNWAGAAADFSEAEQLFLADGDRRNALLARFGRIRGTIEQDQRGLPAVSIQLEEELETNSLLQTDKQLRLWALGL